MSGEDDRIVFLYAGGMSQEVPPLHPPVRFSRAPEEAFAEFIPGYQLALLSHGWYFVSDSECVHGVFVVVRRKR